MKYNWLLPLFVGLPFGIWGLYTLRRGTGVVKVTKDGFSTVAGQPWLDAGVWLANRLNRDKVNPTPAEQQLIVTTFSELGVDETGIIRYSPTIAEVQKVQTDMAGAVATPQVRTIVADFISAAQTLPARVLV
jgi:hypothetical protein